MFLQSRILFLLLLVQFLYSQSSNIAYKHLSVEQGLSYGFVSCILQDSKGFIWISTQDGLNKYDGYKFTIYRHNPEDLNSLSSHRIWTIHEDKSGEIWIGTLGGGLNKFDQDKEQFISYMHNPNDLNSLSHNSVISIFEDNSGNLWVGTVNGGLNKFNPKNKQFVRYMHDPDNSNSLSNNFVTSISGTNSNIIWIGTWGGGLNKFNPSTEQFTNYLHSPNNPNSLSSNIIFSILNDRSGVLWIGSWGGGLNRFNLHTEQFTSYQHNPKNPKSLSNNDVWYIYEDSPGLLWIGTGGGLNKLNLNQGEFIRYQHNSNDPNSLSHNEIKGIFRDKSGVLWIGTNGGGLNKFGPGKERFTHYRHIPNNSNSLNNNNVWPIYEDKSGVLWIGTIGGGLNKFDRKTQQFTHYLNDCDDSNSLSHNSVMSIFEDRTGILWIGTVNGGLNKFDHENMNFTHYVNDFKNPNSLSHNFVTEIYEDNSNTLWIGTWGGGLNKLDRSKEEFTHYKYDPNNSLSLADNIIWSIYEDRLGMLWIGTETGGLNKLDRGKEEFKHYKQDTNNPHSLSSNTVYSIYEDNSGNLWIGTSSGLNILDRKTEQFTHYTVKDGLPNNMINGILEDKNGNLWLSTNKGLSRFNPKTKIFRNYNALDGLQSDEFHFHANFKAKNGEMFFGGINGFNGFYPDSIKDNPHVPPVVLTDFQIFNKSIRPGAKSPLKKSILVTDKIVLSSDQSVFSFEFAALDYREPTKNKYAYQMEGVDPEWVFTDASRRFATYTNLDPGKYIFRVKGSNNDGIWNEEGTSLRIMVTPPWWRTNWAYVLYLVVFGSLVFMIWQFQMNRLKIKHELELEHVHAEKLEEVDRMKSRFFANISHEFRTPLTLIQGPVRQILSGEFSGNLKEQCKMILRNSGRLLELINQLLDLSKLESGQIELQVAKTDISQMIKGLVQSFSTLAGRKKITLKPNIKDKSISGYIDRDKLEKIVNNLFSNALKFTPEGGEVEVALSLRGVHQNGDDVAIPKKIASLNSSARNDDDNGFIQISISNTGVGIPADQLDKIFDRFYQLNESGNQGHMGSGIGLALTKELVEAHHGEIQVQSNYNEKQPPESPFSKGDLFLTTFTVILPVAKEIYSNDEIVGTDNETSPLEKGGRGLSNEVDTTISLLQKEEHPPQSLPKGRSAHRRDSLLLIVEDNPDVTSYICSFMEKDYQILAAENGVLGLKTAVRFP